MHYLHDHLKKETERKKKHEPEINYRVSFIKLLVRRIKGPHNVAPSGTVAMPQ